MRFSWSFTTLGVVVVCAVAAGACQSAPAGPVEIRTVSTAPERVTGGDVLVELSASNTSGLRVTVNGADRTAAFKPGQKPNTLLGLVDGLKEGPNTIAVAGGSEEKQLTVVNHPITGPVFKGPQQTPFICETEIFGLGPALDANCSGKTLVEYLYRANDKTYKRLDPSKPRPNDVAKTTTTDGNTLDWIIRVETGTIDRGIYQLAFLHEPGQPLPTPWQKTPGWNGKLIYAFDGGCSAGYRQGEVVGGNTRLDSGLTLAPREEAEVKYPYIGIVDNDNTGEHPFAEGYAVASNSLNTANHDCDFRLSAEAAMMTKEYFVDHYGIPQFTIAEGTSGATMQQHLLATNFPGIFDGSVPGNSFPDSWTLIRHGIDCSLLVHTFDDPTNKGKWTTEEKGAVAGDPKFLYCSHNGGWAQRINPKRCAQVVPENLRYDPVKNPKGARCTLQDQEVNLYGRDPKTGFARRFVDNVGVQYGLNALKEGKITFDQFAALNSKVGGYDIDFTWVPQRMVGDPKAIEIAYKAGEISNGTLMRSMPIMDVRYYEDDIGGVHSKNGPWIIRERIKAGNGGRADSHVIWEHTLMFPHEGENDHYMQVAQSFKTRDAQTIKYNELETHFWEGIKTMDRWITAIQKDTAPGTQAEKVARNRPAGLVDQCFSNKGETVTDLAKCNEMNPMSTRPRIAAGEPPTDDVIKCQLKPIAPGDYGKPLTAAQVARLKTVFPDGVCDYSKPGVSQQAPVGTWLSYETTSAF